MVQKTILSFWVCVSHDVTPKSLFFVKVQCQVGDISRFNPDFIVPLETSWNIRVSFITPSASHELQEHGDIPWQPQATSWKWVKNHPPGGVKLEYAANGVEVGHAWHVRKLGASPFVLNRFWDSMWATLMPAVKKWAHTCLDHIEEVNMNSHVQNPFL